jgi:uncharacterized protein (TIGR02145 family)
MKNILPFTVFVALALPGNAQTVTDIDGNVYNTVTIGTQVWMVENLKTTHYADGTPILKVTGNSNWGILEITSKAYCWYNDDSATNANTYGALYTWPAAMNGVTSNSLSPSDIKDVCPTGWHLPNSAEWAVLNDYLGGDGGKLKDTTHWISPNTGATNETGFTALPGGSRNTAGEFDGVGYRGTWWSSTDGGCRPAPMCGALTQELDHSSTQVGESNNSTHVGFSVRCLRDNSISIINSIIPDKLIIYPNPATEKLYLKNINYANTTLMIFDLQGKQVLIKQIDSDPIDISNIRKGIYVVKLICSENVLISKFIKE